MKLDEILQESYAPFNISSMFVTASGGHIATPTTPRHGQDPLWDRSTGQRDLEIDIVSKIKAAGEEGWEPEKSLSYTAKNKLETLVVSGILHKSGDRYWITSTGSRWFEDFKRGYQDDITKSHRMSRGAVVGIAK